MAFIVDEGLLTKADKSYSYEELARLKEAADAGDSAAAIRLARLPAGEQRLAVMLVKSFGGKPGKVRKPKVIKSRKRAPGAPQAGPDGVMGWLLNSSDAATAQQARKALSGRV